MDVRRAEQIIASPSIIPVTHNGEPVWIDRIDAGSGTAHIHAEHNPGDTRTVALNQLMEL